ncbi:hypothetical protein D3C76_631870 [compost metagenome]
MGDVVLQQARAAGVPGAFFHAVGQVLEQERHPAERPVRQLAARPRPRLLELPLDHRVDLPVEALDAGDRRIDQLQWRDLPGRHQLRLGDGVEQRELIHSVLPPVCRNGASIVAVQISGE